MALCAYILGCCFGSPNTPIEVKALSSIEVKINVCAIEAKRAIVRWLLKPFSFTVLSRSARNRLVCSSWAEVSYGAKVSGS